MTPAHITGTPARVTLPAIMLRARRRCRRHALFRGRAAASGRARKPRHPDRTGADAERRAPVVRHRDSTRCRAAGRCADGLCAQPSPRPKPRAEEFQRAEQLYQNDTNVARKTRDAARTQSITDEGRVATVRSQILSAWGHSILAMNASARERLVGDVLAASSYAGARGARRSRCQQDARFSRVEISSLNGPARWTASIVGPLPQASAPSFAGAMLLSVPAALSAGQPLQARLVEAAPSVRGPSVPGSGNRPLARIRVGVRGEAGQQLRATLGAARRACGRTRRPRGRGPHRRPHRRRRCTRALLGAELSASEHESTEEADD